jgi:hypothetical protein
MVVPSMKAALIGAVVVVAALGAFLIFSLRATHTDVMTSPVAAPAPIPTVPPTLAPVPATPAIATPSSSSAPAMSATPPDPERAKLDKIHLRDRWPAVEKMLGHKVPDGTRERVEASYARVFASSEYVHRQLQAGKLTPAAATARLSALRDEYRREALSQIGLTEEQLRQLP